MKKWILIMLVIATVAFGSVIGFNLFIKGVIKEAIANMPEPTFPVTAMTLEAQSWQPSIDAIGFVEPHQGVTISNELGGIVTHISFENGRAVEKGQPLIELDTQVEKANLKSKLVQLPATESDFKRMKKLYGQKSVSKQDLDNSEARFLALQADIESLKATIGRREIRAPFAGLVGIRNINLGEYLQPGTDIVRLEDISTMKIRFTIPQTQLPRIALGQTIHVYVDAYPEQAFVGEIAAIEPAVFYQSGLIQVQAQIPNDDAKLRSGMFARVSILLPKLEQQLVLPQSAINFSLYGNSVYVIEQKEEAGQALERVRQLNVTVLERSGNDALVSGDIQPGTRIVTSGQIRLSNNSKVRVVEDDALTPNATLPQL
jgi:membrane fusion protein, multidrug efflux system